MIRKIIFLCSMLLLVVAPVKAQDDEKAAGAAIDTIIRVFSEYEIVDRFVADIYSKYEKDKVKAPILAARIAKAYYNYVMVPGNPTPQFHRRDVAKAFEYLDKAIAIDPKYPQSYLVASDIFYNEAKIDTALIWLDKGIEANPTDSSLYIESAKLLAFNDPEAAVNKLMVLKQRDSTFQVDLQLGRLYYKLYSDHGQLPMKELAETYGRVYDSADRQLLNLGDLGAFSLGLQWASELGDERFAKLYEVTSYGIDLFPKDFGLRKFMLVGCMNTKKWDEGIKTAEFMFAMPDSVKKIDADDYLYYATCLAGKKRYADAIAQYEHVLTMDDASATKKSQADRAIVSTVSTQVGELRQMGDYDQAIAIIEPMVQRNRDKDAQNDNLMIAYATIYTDWAAELNGQERLDAIRNAVKVFDEAATHSELNANMFLHRCCYYSMALDPELKQGLGMPYAQKLVTNLGSKRDLESGEKRYLLLGYEYMMRHEYFIKKNKKAAISWADKMLDVDPTNELALRFITALGG
ncbi:MAG: hypothetical protein K6F43_07980 [Prevotella sp.]|nr:hypothetical protein [Prevotella sp.]